MGVRKVFKYYFIFSNDPRNILFINNTIIVCKGVRKNILWTFFLQLQLLLVHKWLQFQLHTFKTIIATKKVPLETKVVTIVPTLHTYARNQTAL